ncbi:SGNH/GDSL hydrolase family protein [Suilimivivens aceti]|uniref:SGNH/GDSL hydrolase family protein n=1 Tax=Suilimivivens aceti TaxID=2981774 RepID=A0ABT2T5A2_9FIRM|nr:SGNH/GDSL hydrolase family protein [Suilimivivens aceti]MCU6745400.1 SGNH/GDSL hydrolase family protein [Suilimivivens aceti]SCI18250.1 GDSL-like Lipase/Acylhydrolase [uncultured Clostridium sp.]
MNKLNRVMLMLIAMAAIMLLAVGIDKGLQRHERKMWEIEREAVYEEARADIASMQANIQTLSEDPEALISYIEENELNYTEKKEVFLEEPDRAEGDGSVSDNEAYKGEAENLVSGNSVPGNLVYGNFVSGNSVSGNSESENSISGNSISGNLEWGSFLPGGLVSGNLLFPGEEREICASYENTMKINRQDKKIIADSEVDFSDCKITCLGDSITAASNLDTIENYQSMSYPSQLGEILGAEEVVNLGIGGSSIGRYWENAFVDRYQEIPEDTDVILVMGGTNDGFCASEKELGSLEKREKDTFTGDLDELLFGLQKDYPDAQIVLITPLPNVLHDLLRKSRDYLLPQSAFVRVMKQLGEEHGIPVIDLYNSNFLDTHDAAVIHALMPDGVHGNKTGYRMLAQHIAAQLILIEEEEGVEAVGE